MAASRFFCVKNYTLFDDNHEEMSFNLNELNMTPADLFASRYHILRTVGSGGMGVVYLVEDTRKDNKIMALKTIRGAADAEAQAGFRAEFRNVHGVIHPHIPEVFDFGTLAPLGEGLFFTCEFVDGVPLDKLADTWSPAELQDILVKLCRALSFLHSRNLLHRDIKPDNILGRRAENGHVEPLKLVDFGLASHRDSADPTAGTLDYLAPELVEGQAATNLSDIYALGMVLFRLATGQLPFAGDDPLAVARLRTITEAPSALKFRGDLPVGLADVIAAMLRTKPEDRPLTARHVIALLNERSGTEYSYETEATRSAYIRSSSLAAHSEARAVLRESQRQLSAGQTPPPLIIFAEHGLGRRRLIRDFGADLTIDGVAVQMVEPQEPNPVLIPQAIVLIPEAEHLPPDCLNHLLQRVRSGGNWCVLGTSRAETDFDSALGPHRTLRLQPLTLDGVHDYMLATFTEGSFPPPFVQQVYSKTLGLPNAVRTILDQLLDAERLRIGLSGWELLPGAWDLPLLQAVAATIATRLETFSPAARTVVEILGCSPTPLPEALLRQVCANIPIEYAAASAELRSTNWRQASAAGIALTFDGIADYIADSLSNDARRQIHDRLYQAWNAATDVEPAVRQREMLYHDIYAAAWRTPAVEAAATLQVLLSGGDVRRVRKLIEFSLASDPPSAIRDVMLDALISIEYMEGDIARSASRLDELLQHGEVDITDSNRAHIARYAMLEEKLGRTEHAEELLNRCLAALPDGHDGTAGSVFGTLAWIAFKRGEAERARSLAEEGLVRVPPQAADPGHAMLLNTVATLAFYRGETDAAEIYWKRCLEVNEFIRDRKGIASIYNNLGVLAAQSGDRLRSSAMWEQSAAIAQEINDVHRLAGIYNNLGIDALETGRLPEAEDYYLKALAFFRRLKSPREQVAILSNLGELSYYRADYARAQSFLQEAVAMADTLDDKESEIEPLIHLGKVLITLDDVQKAEAVLARASSAAENVGAKKGEGQAWEALALLHARRGDGPAAVSAIDRSHALLAEAIDPLALLHLHLTACFVAAHQENEAGVNAALSEARKVADIKWDPYAAARTSVYGLLFAKEQLDSRERLRILRQLSVYPGFLWRYHWATARRYIADGAARKALDEFARGAAVLKSIVARLSDESRNMYLNSAQIKQFREEAIVLRKRAKEA